MSEDIELRKREIIGELIRRESDVLANLRNIVDKAKEFISIEESSNKIIINSKFGFSNTEKLALVLIGKFLAQQAGLITSRSISLSQLAAELETAATTISGPLGRLGEDGIVKRPVPGEYEIVTYNIEAFLDKLRKGYGVE